MYNFWLLNKNKTYRFNLKYLLQRKAPQYEYINLIKVKIYDNM